jgi:hypothetical protein
MVFFTGRLAAPAGSPSFQVSLMFSPIHITCKGIRRKSGGILAKGGTEPAVKRTTDKGFFKVKDPTRFIMPNSWTPA